VLPAEYDYQNKKFLAQAPIDIVQKFADSNNASLDVLTSVAADSSIETWKDFPEVPEMVRRIWRDPLLTESGSLTSERNYSTYAVGMGHTDS